MRQPLVKYKNIYFANIKDAFAYIEGIGLSLSAMQFWNPETKDWINGSDCEINYLDVIIYKEKLITYPMFKEYNLYLCLTPYGYALSMGKIILSEPFSNTPIVFNTKEDVYREALDSNQHIKDLINTKGKFSKEIKNF